MARGWPIPDEVAAGISLPETLQRRSRLTDSQITFRRGRPEDTRPAFDVSIAAMSDLFVRQGQPWGLDTEAFWTSLEPILIHLAATAAEWWVAIDEADGSMVGYARSIERGGLIELSELFVLPDRQSAGIGGRLIERAFPTGRGEVRVIIATSDVRALARYYRAGTVVRFPIAEMTGAPRQSDDAVELEAIPATLDDVAELAAIEEAVIGYPRHADYPWLIEHREGHLYRRDERSVGFAFVSRDGSGPIAALEPAELVPILLHAETRAHALGMDEVSFEVPMPNEVAMRHLLGRGFKIDPPLTLFMSSVPFGRFDRFIAFAPSVVL
jgi:GNAT superfamily N-acetyltransferase